MWLQPLIAMPSWRVCETTSSRHMQYLYTNLCCRRCVKFVDRYIKLLTFSRCRNSTKSKLANASYKIKKFWKYVCLFAWSWFSPRELNNWGLYLNFFTVVINSVMQKASTFVKASAKCLTIAKTLGYCIQKFITSVISFMTQSPGANVIKLSYL